jgi:hypothetical protein
VTRPSAATSPEVYATNFFRAKFELAIQLKKAQLKLVLLLSPNSTPALPIS